MAAFTGNFFAGGIVIEDDPGAVEDSTYQRGGDFKHGEEGHPHSG